MAAPIIDKGIEHDAAGSGKIADDKIWGISGLRTNFHPHPGSGDGSFVGVSALPPNNEPTTAALRGRPPFDKIAGVDRAHWRSLAFWV